MACGRLRVSFKFETLDRFSGRDTRAEGCLVVMQVSAPTLQHGGTTSRSRPGRVQVGVTFPWWLQHLARTQGVAAVAALAALCLLSSAAYTNPPVASRRILQLSNAAENVQTNDKSLGAMPATTLLRAPALDQLPNYYNGCEITSLAMLLQFAGYPTSLAELAASVPRDPQPLVVGQDGAIVSWGNPNDGFVGSVSGREPGYGVYHAPIANLLDKFAPGEALDLSGGRFSTLLATVASGRPVIVWTTVNFLPPTQWVTWSTPQGPVRATMAEHAVLLVGFNRQYAFVNNPLTGERAQPVPLATFRSTWVQMGRQAVTIRAPAVAHVTGIGRR